MDFTEFSILAHRADRHRLLDQAGLGAAVVALRRDRRAQRRTRRPKHASRLARVALAAVVIVAAFPEHTTAEHSAAPPPARLCSRPIGPVGHASRVVTVCDPTQSQSASSGRRAQSSDACSWHRSDSAISLVGVGAATWPHDVNGSTIHLWRVDCGRRSAYAEVAEPLLPTDPAALASCAWDLADLAPVAPGRPSGQWPKIHGGWTVHLWQRTCGSDPLYVSVAFLVDPV